MTHDAITPKYNRGDVVIGERLHANTSTPVSVTQYDGTKEYRVQGKKRPMLVVGTPKTKPIVYQTLDFTTRKPDNGDSNFFLQANGKPRCFGKRFGFKDLSYLKVYPIDTCPENRMNKQDEISPFPKVLMDAIITECARSMQMAQAAISSVHVS